MKKGEPRSNKQKSKKKRGSSNPAIGEGSAPFTHSNGPDLLQRLARLAQDSAQPGALPQGSVGNSNNTKQPGAYISYQNTTLPTDFADDLDDDISGPTRSDQEPLLTELATNDAESSKTKFERLIRYLFRDQIINRTELLVYTGWMYPDRANWRRLWLEGRAIVLEPDSYRTFHRNTEYYLRGKDTFMKYLWPVTLLTMMAYDGIQLYRLPELSFSNTPLDIFGGTSPNSLSIATDMGSDIAAEWQYWLGFAILIAGPIIMGIANIALHQGWQNSFSGIDPADIDVISKPLKSSKLREAKQYIESVRNIEEASLFYEYERCFYRSVDPNNPSWLNPFSRYRRLLDRIVFTILYQPNLHQNIAIEIHAVNPPVVENDDLLFEDDDDNPHHLAHQHIPQYQTMTKREFLFRCINNLITDSKTLSKFFAYQALGEIVDKLNGLNLRLQSQPMVAQPDVEEVDLEPSLSSRYTQKDTLKSSGLIGKYQLWLTGYVDLYTEPDTGSKAKNLAINALFFSYSSVKKLWLIYAYYRYYRFLIEKIIGAYQFFSAQSACHAENRIYMYNPDIGNYDCSICGDWPAVFDPYTAEGCLSGVLQLSSNPDSINKALSRISPFIKNLSGVSLVDQSWLVWSEQQFADFVGNVSVANPIGKFNLSRVDYNIVFPQNTNKIRALANANQRSCVSSWDFTNQRMGDAARPFIQSLWNNSCVRDLVITGNALTDQGFRDFADIFNTTLITNLVLDHNLLSGEMLSYFSENIRSSSLQRFSVESNFLGQSGLNALGQLLQRNEQLDQILVGSNNLAGLDFTAFGSGLQSRSLSTLRINGCSLGDDEIAAIAPYLNTTYSVNLADNNGMSRQGAEVLMASLQGARTAELSLRGMPMDDQTLQQLRLGLPATSITNLDLSQSQIKGSDFEIFMQNLTTTKIRILKASDNLFGPQAGLTVAKIISQQNLSFDEFDFSSNNLGDEAGAALVSALSKTSPKIKLRLNNNSLGSKTATALATMIQSGRIVELEIESNQFSSAALNQIVKALPLSALQYLNYRNNGVVTDGSPEVNIAKQLLVDLPDAGDLTQDPTIRDLARWIHNKGMPQTNLTRLNAENNNVSVPGARALCNVLHASHLKHTDIQIRSNGVNPIATPCFFNRANTSFNAPQLPVGRTLETTQSSTAGLWMLGATVPILGLIVIIVLVYKWLNSSSEEKMDDIEERNDFQP